MQNTIVTTEKNNINKKLVNCLTKKRYLQNLKKKYYFYHL